MKEFNLVASPGVLGLRSNRASVAWSYGVTIPPSTRAALDECAVKINLEVMPELPPVESGPAFGKYHYFRGKPLSDKIHYERTLVMNRSIQFEVGGLVGGQPYLRCNEAYWRFVPYRFMNLHSIGYILTDIASLLLLRSGYAPLHCSAFRKGNSGVVVFAPPNTGKTLTTMQVCMNLGGEFLAEDLAITDGRTLYAVPWTSTFRYYGEIEQSRASRLRHRLVQYFPPLELLPGRSAKSVQRYVDSSAIAEKAEITHIIILERGETTVEPLSREDAFRRIRNLNRYEFNYAKAPTAVAYEYFNPKLDLDGASECERKTLWNMVCHAKEIMVVRSSNPVDYAQMVWSSVP